GARCPTARAYKPTTVTGGPLTKDRLPKLLELAAGPGFSLTATMNKSNRLSEALDRLAAAEEQFFAREFLAPVVRGGAVRVRIAGVLCKLQVQAADFQGWGVFRPRSHTEAHFVRPARLAERQRYLELFPRVRLILAWKQNDQWLGMPGHRADS